MPEFEGLVAIVTGGASGIGAAIVDRLRSAGAKVAIFDINTIETSDENSLSVAVNVSNDESVRDGVQQTIDTFGQIDIVVNNAGIGAQGTVTANDDAEWLRVFDVNVFGMARLTRATIPYLLESKSGAVVNISSIAATAGLPERVLYSATKGAVSAMTRAMAADYIRLGVRVNAVNPGTADTPWVANLLSKAENPEAERAALNARQPHGRLVMASEIADAVAYLASPLSGSTTGTSIAVDGGMQDLRLRPQS
ncbi:MAG: SDR family oxidoreductase [Aurantimicrobium sp.]|uniref:SDR family NAD(P)-dependent oxidoreductase n=1 Tax=Aurantimicrobium sp. TaxID=1930784 RepID=UPI002FCA8469